ncbi:MAG: MauE/DoxX family redox-associated membrane protein [Rhodoglobus sp.]
MSTFSLVAIDVATGLIAVVLLASGIAKVRTPGRTVDAMAALGVPGFFRRGWIAALLPVVEIVVGGVLLLAPGLLRLLAALAATVMMLVFIALIGKVVASGEDVSCECFGALSRDPVDRWTLVRNVLLLVASAVAACAGTDGSSLVLSLPSRSGTELALLVTTGLAVLAVAVLGTLVLATRRQLRRAREVGSAAHEQGEPITGTPVPPLELVDSRGVTVTLPRLGGGRAVLLLFVRTGCGNCGPVARAFPEWQERLGESVLIVAATSSDPNEMATDYPEYGESLRFGSLAVRSAIGVRMVPCAVVLGSNGLIASEIVEGSAAIDALVGGLEQAIRVASPS